MSQDKITLADVARRAGVSAMSVSNFVNGRHGAMTETTRDRIAEAVTALNYRPHSAARSIRSARTWSIGLIVVDESPTYLSDGYTTQVVSGLGDMLNARGYTLQLEGLPAGRLSQSRLIRHRQTDGLCVLPSGDQAARRRIIATVAATGQPVVLLLETLPRSIADGCAVLQSDRKGARELAMHLLASGAQRILCLKQTYNQWQAVAERQAGITDAVEASGEGAHLDVLGCGEGTFEDVTNALSDYLVSAPMPDAIMASNDQIGIAVLKDLKSRGISVPGEVKVTGFNAFDFWKYSDPVLTTVRSPGFELGQEAGRAMIERLEAGRFNRSKAVLETTLQPGETV
jgi:DNA-binding LacI/PurR family transcriptional regulator